MTTKAKKPAKRADKQIYVTGEAVIMVPCRVRFEMTLSALSGLKVTKSLAREAARAFANGTANNKTGFVGLQNEGVELLEVLEVNNYSDPEDYEEALRDEVEFGKFNIQGVSTVTT